MSITDRRIQALLGAVLTLGLLVVGPLSSVPAAAVGTTRREVVDRTVAGELGVDRGSVPSAGPTPSPASGGAGDGLLARSGSAPAALFGLTLAVLLSGWSIVISSRRRGRRRSKR